MVGVTVNPVSFTRSLEDLITILSEQGVPHRAELPNRMLYLEAASGLPGPIAIHWQPQVPFLTVTQLVLREVPGVRIAELERAIVRANHHVQVPAFGFDHRRSDLYYRVAAPVYVGIDSNIVDRLARGVIATAKEFSSSFQAVVDGRAGADFADIYRSYAQLRDVQVLFDGSF